MLEKEEDDYVIEWKIDSKSNKEAKQRIKEFLNSENHIEKEEADEIY